MFGMQTLLNALKIPEDGFDDSDYIDEEDDLEEENTEEEYDEAEDYYNSPVTPYNGVTGVVDSNRGIVIHQLGKGLDAQYTALDERYGTQEELESSSSVQKSVQSVQNGVKLVSFPVRQGVQSVQNGVQTEDETVLEVSHGQDWTHRAQRNAKKYRPVAYKSVIATLTLFVIMLILTYEGQPLHVLIGGYSLVLVLALLTDPIRACERYMANITRYLLAFDILILNIAYMTHNVNIWKVVGIITALILYSTYTCNKMWIIQETVQTSVAMERALNSDPHGNAQNAWNSYGWKQTQTMIHEYGLVIPREELLGWVACVYKLGFIHSQSKNVFGESMKKKAEDKIKRLERDLDAFKSLADKGIKLESEVQRLKNEVERLKSELLLEKDRARQQQDTLDKYRTENETLKATNADLVNQYGNTEEIIDFREEMKDRETDRIYELIDAGTSIRKTADILGITKGKVEKALNARKEAQKELEKAE